MPQIMRQGSALHHVSVEATVGYSLLLMGSQQVFGQPPGDLGDLQGVGKAVVEDVPFGGTDDLSDARQPPESLGIENPVAVLLVGASLILHAVMPARGTMFFSR